MGDPQAHPAGDRADQGARGQRARARASPPARRRRRSTSTATELTANRAGLILCNAIEVAAKLVSIEPATLGSPPPKEKVKELLLYSISEEYLHVRVLLGMSIAA